MSWGRASQESDALRDVIGQSQNAWQIRETTAKKWKIEIQEMEQDFPKLEHKVRCILRKRRLMDLHKL